jgi:hypothetical protein
MFVKISTPFQGVPPFCETPNFSCQNLGDRLDRFFAVFVDQT